MINATTPLLPIVQNRQIDNTQGGEPFVEPANAAIATSVALYTATFVLMLKDDKTAGIASLGCAALASAASIVLAANADYETALQATESNNNQVNENTMDEVKIDMFDLEEIA